MATDNERPSRGNDGEGRRGAERNSFGRPASDRGSKKVFNRRDKPAGSEGGERRAFNPDRRDNDRRDGGSRGSYGGDRRQGGEKRSFGGERSEGYRGDNRTGGERRPYGSQREGGESRSFSTGRPQRDNDRKPFGAREGDDRRPSRDRQEGGERRSFTTSSRREAGDKRTFGDKREGNDRRSYSPGNRDEQRTYGDRREGGERRSYGDKEAGNRRSSGTDSRFSGRGNREDSYGGDRRGSTDRKPYGGERNSKPFDGGNRSFGDKKTYTNSRTDRDNRPDSRGRGRASESDSVPETPDYNLARYKHNTRIKKTNIKEEEDGSIRLNRFIANAGICSRREADLLIEAGEIKVNGEVVTEMGFKVQPTDSIQYGKKILNREKLVYVLLNKPKDFLTTTDDPEGRKTVMSLVANASTERIFPVGRLDRNTTGLLLFTNDGELAQKLTHPSNEIKKIYQVELDKPITKADYEKIAEGIELEDGKATVDDLALLGDTDKFLGLEIHIGRNRIVRRIFEHLGYDVVSLDRVQYAGLTKKDLPRSNWRYLSEKEVIRLKFFM